MLCWILNFKMAELFKKNNESSEHIRGKIRLVKFHTKKIPDSGLPIYAKGKLWQEVLVVEGVVSAIYNVSLTFIGLKFVWYS
jgi:hypothetical protein